MGAWTAAEADGGMPAAKTVAHGSVSKDTATNARARVTKIPAAGSVDAEAAVAAAANPSAATNAAGTSCLGRGWNRQRQRNRGHSRQKESVNHYALRAIQTPQLSCEVTQFHRGVRARIRGGTRPLCRGFGQ